MTSMVQTDFGPAVSASASSSSATPTAIDTAAAAAAATTTTAPKYKESPIDDSVCAYFFSYIFLIFLFLNSIPGFPSRRGYGQGVFQITMLP